MAGTGRTAARKARRQAKILRRMREFQERAAQLKEFRAVYGQAEVALSATGLGEESSGVQGIRSSLNATIGGNLAFAAESGRVNTLMLAHAARAKKNAANFRVATIAASVVTLGAASAFGAAAAATATNASAALFVPTVSVGGAALSAGLASIPTAIGVGSALGGIGTALSDPGALPPSIPAASMRGRRQQTFIGSGGRGFSPTARPILGPSGRPNVDDSAFHKG